MPLVDALHSLHFERVRESGFSVHAKIPQNSWRPNPSCYATLHILSNGVKYPQVLSFTPVISPGRTELYYFPYIGDSGLLQLWDVSNNCPLELYGHVGRKVPGWPARYARKRWPRLFKLACNDGLWEDV